MDKPVDTSVDWERLTRYLSGQCSLEEVRSFERWVAEDSERRALVDDIRAAWSAGSAETDASVDVRGGWRQVERDIADHAVVGRVSTGSPSRSWRWVAGAMAVAAIVIATILTIRPTNQPMREFTTPVGSRLSVVLRDGTRLTLGPDTRVRIPTDFGVHAREVELTGEATFAVVHDIRHPFAVHTQGATITDVGTEFDVQAYPESPGVHVAVAAGWVAIGTTMLGARDMADIVDHHVMVTHHADIDPYFAWAQGHLVFDATPLREVVRQLGRTFNLDIKVPDSTLTKQRVTASFTDQPVEAILEDIVALVGARYERTGRAVVIKRDTSWHMTKPHPQQYTSHQ